MKIKKLSASMRFLVGAMIVVVLSMAIFGVSTIFAEPKIEDLVDLSEIGSFKPSNLYDDETADIKLVAWLNTTQLMFSYDWWIDVSGDGLVDVDDVYAQPGFEQEMLMTNALYPIFQTEDDSNCYIVPLPDYDDYNGVVTELRISENNDLAQLKDEDTYWFDRENSYLYIDRGLIEDALKDEDFVSIRAETIMLFKDIEDATKTINIYTLFDEDIEKTHGLNKSTPNDLYDFNISDWLLGCLQYRLVPSRHLAYVSEDNLTVYVNGEETDRWSYDETTGYIAIDCDPYTTRDVAVKFNEITDTTFEERTIQMFQGLNGESVGQAADLQGTLNSSGDNAFLKYVAFDNEPQIGATTELGFTGFAYVDTSGKDAEHIASLYTGNSEGLPVSAIKNTIANYLKDKQLVNGYFKTTTISAQQQSNKYISDITGKYGNIIYNMHLAKTNSSKINDAVSLAQTDLLGSIDVTGLSNDKALTSVWKTYIGKDYVSGTYITGTLKEDFLGGKIKSDSGYAFFDLNCANITAPSTAVYNAMHGNGEVAAVDYKAYATIVSTKKTSENGGYLYICIWSQSVQSPSSTKGSQRLLGFSRVPYRYSRGNIQLIKVDAISNETIGGAKYAVYQDPSCSIFIKDLISPFNPSSTDPGNEEQYENSVVTELRTGTYYVKETGIAEGYLADRDESGHTKVHKVTVSADKTTVLTIKTNRQQCVFTLSVYDQTGDRTSSFPLTGVEFELYDPQTDQIVATYTTDGNGQIPNISVDATRHRAPTDPDDPEPREYWLSHKNTRTNYSMSSACDKIIVDATPNTSGSNITISERSTLNIIHYEKRQDVEILSQIQDATLKGNTQEETDELQKNTPAVLSNTNGVVGEIVAKDGQNKNIHGGYVSTVGAQYELHVQDGQSITTYHPSLGEITVSSGGPLEILTWNKKGEEAYQTAAYSKSVNGKSYIVAKGLRVNVNGQKVEVPLPNGAYEWRLVEPSPGYQDNDAVTVIDATWNKDNRRQQPINKDDAVKQMRQTAEITLYVKYYKDGVATTDGMVKPIRDTTTDNGAQNELGARLWPKANRKSAGKWTDFVDTSFEKAVWSDSADGVTQTSTEVAELFVDGKKYTVKTYKDPDKNEHGVVPNAIYELINLCEIVDVDTGEPIKAGTVLGYYQSKSDGSLTITHLSNYDWVDNPNTADIDESVFMVNPNAESNISVEKIKRAEPTTKYNSLAKGALPNGIYGLSLVVAADGYKAEEGLYEDIITELQWGEDEKNNNTLTANTVVMLYKDDTNSSTSLQAVRVAPEIDPDGTNDIPLTTIDWIDIHQDNRAYRISDPGNTFIGKDKNGNEAVISDVDDLLPTTFGFYFDDDMITSTDKNYQYQLSFYYEITKAEYDNASQELKNNETYIKISETEYAKRFKTDILSQDEIANMKEYGTVELLQDVIELRADSINYNNNNAYGIVSGKVNPNEAISGAVKDVYWINNKLAQESDGEFRIYVFADVTLTYKTKGAEQPVEVLFANRKYDPLIIKNRRLVDLD